MSQVARLAMTLKGRTGQQESPGQGCIDYPHMTQKSFHSGSRSCVKSLANLSGLPPRVQEFAVCISKAVISLKAQLMRLGVKAGNYKSGSTALFK